MSNGNTRVDPLYRPEALGSTLPDLAVVLAPWLESLDREESAGVASEGGPDAQVDAGAGGSAGNDEASATAEGLGTEAGDGSTPGEGLGRDVTVHVRNLVVLADANPEHHAARLRNVDDRGNPQDGICMECYRNLVAEFPGGREELGETIRASKDRSLALAERRQNRQRLARARRAAVRPHVEHVRSHRDGERTANREPADAMPTMDDMQGLTSGAEALAGNLNAFSPRVATGHAGYVESIDDAVDWLRRTAMLWGPIDVVAIVGHGFVDGIRCGGTLENRRGDGAGPRFPDGYFITGEPEAGDASETGEDDESDLENRPQEQAEPEEGEPAPEAAGFIDRINEYLADQVRFVLYACDTAGGINSELCRGEIEAYEPLSLPQGDQPFAVHLCRALAEGRRGAEVWGHLGPGSALRRPFWARVSAGEALDPEQPAADATDGATDSGGLRTFSVRDHCLARGRCPGGFRGGLEQVLGHLGYGEDSYPPARQATWYIPLWPVAFERTTVADTFAELWGDDRAS